jgi:hypothetical protein
MVACHLLARWFAELFFDPEDGGDTFLRNVGYHSTHYTASYPRRRYASKPPLSKPQILHKFIYYFKVVKLFLKHHVHYNNYCLLIILIYNPKGQRVVGRPDVHEMASFRTSIIMGL